MKLVENLEYWATFKIDCGKGLENEPLVTTPRTIAEDAAQLLKRNFNLPLASAQAMVLASGRATGEAGLVVDSYTNAYYQYCLMMTETEQGEAGP